MYASSQNRWFLRALKSYFGASDEPLPRRPLCLIAKVDPNDGAVVLSDSAHTITATLSIDALDTLREGIVKDNTSSFAGWTIHLIEYHFEVTREPSSITLFVNALDVRSRLPLVSPRVPELVDDPMADRVLKSLKYDPESEKWVPRHIFPKLTKSILEIPAEQEKCIRDTFTSERSLSQPLDDSDDESVVRFLEQNQEKENDGEDEDEERVQSTGIASSSIVLSQYDPSDWERLVDSYVQRYGDEGRDHPHNDDYHNQKRCDELPVKVGGDKDSPKESAHDLGRRKQQIHDDVDEIESPLEEGRDHGNTRRREIIDENHPVGPQGDEDVEIIDEGSIEVRQDEKEKEEKKEKCGGSIQKSTVFHASHSPRKETESAVNVRVVGHKSHRASTTGTSCDWGAFCGSMGYASIEENVKGSRKKRKK
eukprot:TRINITY_DN40401_c0_g1_i1.p1 TRINITY_DN40401_c0_g1~~TRINITY_DN40401_c0_g1_i1.p1  ORF type:complete len:423 (-),score=107.87 TRINITY_DN40401_c0_g1_i1:651-1919(-)